MSSPGSPTLDLDVRPRRIEQRIASTAVATAVLSPWLLSPVHPWILALLSIAAGLTVAAGFWRAGWIGTRYRLARISWLADGRWILVTHGGESLEATLSAGTRRGSAFAWLRWQAPHPYSMLLVHGDLRRGELRRLLVRLSIDRLRGPTPVRFAAEEAAGGSTFASLRTFVAGTRRP